MGLRCWRGQAELPGWLDCVAFWNQFKVENLPDGSDTIKPMASQWMVTLSGRRALFERKTLRVI